MRPHADSRRVVRLLTELGGAVRAPHRIYLTGGASAVLVGWRDSTYAVDLRAEPDSDELLRAIGDAKRQLDIKVKLASPLDFLPALHDWRERSPSVGSYGAATVQHIDFRLQALSKIQRGFEQDLADVEAMLERELVTPAGLRAAFAELSGQLFRFPAVDEQRFAAAVNDALRAAG